MRIFYLWLRFNAAYAMQRIEWRIHALSTQLVNGVIDVEEYVARRKIIEREKTAALADYNRWNDVLTSLQINTTEEAA